METLIIMNYENGMVYITYLPKNNNWQSEDYEEYISEELGIKTSSINWMVSDNLNPIENI